MNFEWDEQKRLINIEKHGVDFIDVVLFEFDSTYEFEYKRNDETRITSYGYINDRLHCLVYTERNVSIRVISLRKANNREENRYG